MAILTNTELRALRDIGNKIDTDKADEAINLAETVDLYNVLGDFYFDVVANKASVVAGWVDLFAGSTFTVAGRNFIHLGIKAVIADLAYARYTEMINTNFTPFGATVKSSQDSEPISEARLAQIQLQAKRDADSKFGLVDKYLNTDTTLFARYFETEDCKPDAVNGRQNWSII
jgi:hypothetical protein